MSVHFSGPEKMNRHKFLPVNRGAACMPFDEQRQFGPPTGRSSASNTYGRNGGAQRVRGSAESQSSVRLDLVTGFGDPRSKLGFRLSRRRTGNTACLRGATRGQQVPEKPFHAATTSLPPCADTPKSVLQSEFDKTSH
jgi:hypothetical protein